MMSPFKIVFMGSPETALPSLKVLLASDDQVVGVVSQPDRPAGRGRTLTSPAVATLAREKKIPLFQPEKIKNNPELLNTLKQLSPDLIVIVAYGRILPKEILSLPPMKCLNVHFSLLPQYRGAAPIQWALMNDEATTGVTTFYLVEKLDAGPILMQKKVVVEPEDNVEILGNRLAVVGSQLLRETIALLKGGGINAVPQNERQVTLAPPLKKEDGLIDWSRKAKVIRSQVRGTTPWPGAYTLLKGKIFKIASAAVIPLKKESAVPGEIIQTGEEGIEVACGRDGLLLKEVQLEGGKKMDAAVFLKGHPLAIGERLGKE